METIPRDKREGEETGKVIQSNNLRQDEIQGSREADWPRRSRWGVRISGGGRGAMLMTHKDNQTSLEI